jgi:hypothetical protein
LYAFGGEKLQTTVDVIFAFKYSCRLPNKITKTFAVQRLKLRKSDEKEAWEVLYYQCPLPFSHLYVNKISEDDIIIFGQQNLILNPKAKAIGFYYCKSESLTDFQDGIIYLEEHGLADAYTRDSGSKKKGAKKVEYEAKQFVDKDGLVRLPSRKIEKVFPANHYYTDGKFIYLWLKNEAMMILRVPAEDMVPSVLKTVSWRFHEE